jgi:undecaprenyl-diphosphatase
MWRARRLFLGLVLFGLGGGSGFAASAYADTIGPVPPGQPAGTTQKVTYPDAFALGLVEGLTEYLPVSSVGHTIIVTHALGLDSPEQLLDREGRPILITHRGETQPLTLKQAVDTYNVIVQAGPIAAILLLFWRRVWSLVRGALGRDPAGLLLLRNLLIAFVPAMLLGLAAERYIDRYLFSYRTVAAALVVGALVMLAVEYWRRAHWPGAEAAPGPELHELTWRQALLIGLCQCASLWPGTSRSMTTIIGGYFVGLRPARAAEFSFLLGLITLTAASGYKALEHGAELRQGLDLGPLVFGIAVATLAAALAVRWFISWLSRYGLSAFAWYRLALAAVVMAVMR